MKNSIGIMVLMFWLFACSKDESTPANSFKISIEGIPYTMKQVTTQVQTQYDVEYLIISGAIEDDPTSVIGVLVYVPYKLVKAGDDIDITSDYGGIFVAFNGVDIFEASNYSGSPEGHIKIRKNNLSKKRIEGTFSGVVVYQQDDSQTLDCTDGSFAISY